MYHSERGLISCYEAQNTKVALFDEGSGWPAVMLPSPCRLVVVPGSLATLQRCQQRPGGHRRDGRRSGPELERETFHCNGDCGEPRRRKITPALPGIRSLLGRTLSALIWRITIAAQRRWPAAEYNSSGAFTRPLQAGLRSSLTYYTAWEATSYYAVRSSGNLLSILANLRGMSSVHLVTSGDSTQ